MLGQTALERLVKTNNNELWIIPIESGWLGGNETPCKKRQQKKFLAGHLIITSDIAMHTLSY